MDARDAVLLQARVERIWEIAHGFGLDPYPVHFELVPATIMHEFGAYGLPGRFSHWTHGRAYQQLKTMYDYGLSKIYELVVNTNPAYAFLVDNNSVLQNTVVVAHVLGHVDFFKHNAYFTPTNRQMIEGASVNAERIRGYEYAHGQREVEEFLDAVLSIQEHVDPSSLVRADRPPLPVRKPPPERPYDDLFYLGSTKRPQPAPAGTTVPPEPEKDLLLFIAEYARDLEDWQRDLIHIVRAEQIYFRPQMLTKVMNEGWACATGDSLVVTEHGLLRFRDLYEAGKKIRVGSGGRAALEQITALHAESRVPTIRIRTRRGYTIEGAVKHRVQLASGAWATLEDLHLGDRVALACGTDVWASQPLALDYIPAPTDASLTDVARLTCSSLSTVLRHRAGRTGPRAAAIESALLATSYGAQDRPRVLATRRQLRLPATLDESLAWLLGAFVGDGNVTKSGVCITSGDAEHASELAAVAERALGLVASLRAHHTGTGLRWRVEVHSRELLRLLEHLGLDLGARAARKQVPETILRSPRSVVSAFLRGYFDADGYAGTEGVILSSASRQLIDVVQIVLLNYGILATQRRQAKGCWHLEVKGRSATLFRDLVGFGLERKRRALDAYVDGHRWYKPEDRCDEIVAIERGREDVFDITVDSAHTYVANGLVNHNSFWHARVMHELDLDPIDYVEFSRMHAGVLATSRRQVNPYFVGMRIFEDIERRWNEP
ncbi:MAG: SpoVR family protein, partial [Solirubrobacterales bacterium]|nr:SpoVR family protein [Solirubrobacterales bacterium]